VACHNRPVSFHDQDIMSSLNEPTLLKNKVQPCDIGYAEEIAEYYKNKLVTRALTQTDHGRDGRCSTFNRDLGQALRLNDEFTCKEEFFPILYRLPDFYIEDQSIDKLVQNYVSHHGHPWSVLGNNVIVGELKFVKKVVVKKRTYNVTVYYFSDPDQHLIRIPVPKDSVTMPVMDLLTQAKSFIMMGNTISKSIQRDYKDFVVLEPMGTKWEITDLEM